MKTPILHSLVRVVIVTVLLHGAARAQDSTPAVADVDIPLSVKEMKSTFVITGDGQADLMVNVPTLQRVVLSPQDVVDASLVITLQSPPLTGSIAIALAPANGGDAKPLATLSLDQFTPDPLVKGAKTLSVPGLGDLVRKALTDSPAGIPLTITTSNSVPNAKYTFNSRATVMNVKIVSHPKQQLFTPPVQPRDGVYTQARDGHLYYGDQRLRLWGCVRPQVPNVETADRIAAMGFNAIRMWGPREPSQPPGTSILVNEKTGEYLPVTQGDGSPLDEYDRFFAEAKKMGLFIMATGLTDTPIDQSQGSMGKAPTDQFSWLKGDGQNWDDWQKAILSKPDPWVINFMAAADDRCFKARQQQVKNYLTHVNPYTGKSYAQDEAIAIYELANENAHVKRTVEKGFDKWPPFFVSELQQRWNKWLVDRYHDDAGLTQAWKKLDPGESLTTTSVKLEPIVEHSAAYSEQRGSDFVRFLIDINSDLNKRIEDYARSFAPKGVGVAVIPFSYDTQYMPSNAWLFDDTQNGDVANFGMYFWLLTNPLTKPPGMYVIDSNTVEKKVTVLYETMDGRPDPYRAAYPYRLAALASWEDWDAIFFHYWDGFHVAGRTFPEEAYLAGDLSYIAPTHYWTSVYYEKDPALLSPMAIAGMMFRNAAISPAPHPLTYVLGAKSIFSLGALGGSGLTRATYTQGARIRFAPDSDTNVTIEGTPEQSLDTPPTGAVAMGDQVLWDWPNGRLIIDTPTAKAYVGIPHGKYRFKDGIVVGGFEGKFVSFGMISIDGKPLTGSDASKQIYITAANDAKNTGYHIKFNEATDPVPTGGPPVIGRLIDNEGTSPVIVDKVPYEIWFPTGLSGRFDGYDLVRRQRVDKPISGGHVQHDGSELYLASLTIDNPGQAVETPQSDVIEAAASTDSAGVSAPAQPAIEGLSEVWNPLPGVKWSDALEDVQGRLTASGVHFQAFTANADDLHLADTDALFHSAAEADVLFKSGRMTGINVTFSQPPVMADVIAVYDKELGTAVVKDLAASEDKVSTVKWILKKDRFTVTTTLTETQGTLSISYVISM